MKIVFLHILFFISVAFSEAQNLSLEIIVDKNLTATFPSVIDSFEVEKTKIYNTNSGMVQFSVSKHTSTVIDKSKVEFDSSLSTFRKSIDSFSKSLFATKLYQDTVLGGTKAFMPSSIVLLQKHQLRRCISFILQKIVLLIRFMLNSTEQMTPMQRRK